MFEQAKLVVRKNRGALDEGNGISGPKRHRANLLRLVTHDNRSGKDIAQPLVVSLEKDEQQAEDGRGRWLEVYYADQVANYGRREVDRVPGVHDDAYSDPAFSRGSATSKRLEQHKVSPEDDEPDDDQQGGGPRAGKAGKDSGCPGRDGDRKHQREKNQQIHQGGGRA